MGLEVAILALVSSVVAGAPWLQPWLEGSGDEVLLTARAASVALTEVPPVADSIARDSPPVPVLDLVLERNNTHSAMAAMCDSSDLVDPSLVSPVSVVEYDCSHQIVNEETQLAVRISPEEAYAAQIDRHIRQRHDYHSPGYLYCIDRLRSELPLPRSLRALAVRIEYVRFLKRRDEFRVVAGKAVELARLTPFRLPGRRVFGRFHCVVKYCDHTWTSTHSFADTSEPCPRCGARVFPFEQQADLRSLSQPEPSPVRSPPRGPTPPPSRARSPPQRLPGPQPLRSVGSPMKPLGGCQAVRSTQRPDAAIRRHLLY